MLETPHVILGATIAFKIPNPFIALPLVFLSHLLLDYIPHWNPNLGKEMRKLGKISQPSKLIIWGDVMLGLVFGLGIASRAWPNWEKAAIIIVASFLAVVLDVIEGFYFFLGARHQFLKNLINFQHRHQTRFPLIPGLLTQLIVILLSLYILRS